MKAGSIRALWITAVFLLFGSVAFGDSFTFTTIPASGNLSGPAGSTLGWGYQITNQSLTDWLSVTNLVADLFEHGTPNGSIFDFPIVAPGDSVTLAYDAINFLGLFQCTWDSDAPDGFTNSGNFVLSGDWYDADPLNGGLFIAAASDVVAPYSVSVTAGGTSPAPVPEPSTWLLLVSGLGAIFRLNKTKRRNTVSN